MVRAVDPDIAVRRGKRFFGDGGLCERYERRGDELVQFGDLLNWLITAVPGLDQKIALLRFRFSVRHGGFCRRGLRRTIEHLVDLDDYSNAPCGAYSLRPTGSRADYAPLLMRARASVWAEWLKKQGWPVPAELSTLRNSEHLAQQQHVEQPEVSNELAIENKAISEPQPAAPKRIRHKGGAPPRVREPLEEWYRELSDKDKGLSDTKLAEIYKTEKQNSPGEFNSIRKLIAHLREQSEP